MNKSVKTLVWGWVINSIDMMKSTDWFIHRKLSHLYNTQVQFLTGCFCLDNHKKISVFITRNSKH